MVRHIDTEELDRMMQSATVVLVDVRADVEVARGMIAGARHIPLPALAQRCSELEPSAATVVYCQSGGRSALACAQLAEQGFAHLLNLQGGLSAWLRDGKPLVTPR
jgi:rhodanese-related sulfurtransferase